MKVYSRGVCWHFQFKLLDVYSVLAPRVYLRVVSPVSWFYTFTLESFSRALLKTVPFMLDFRWNCFFFSFPPLPRCHATVCQDKQTGRQLSRGLGLLWKTCQGSLPLLQSRGFLFQPRTHKLEVVPLTTFLWHGKDRNHMWEHPCILFHFGVGLKARPSRWIGSVRVQGEYSQRRYYFFTLWTKYTKAGNNWSSFNPVALFAECCPLTEPGPCTHLTCSSLI